MSNEITTLPPKTTMSFPAYVKSDAFRSNIEKTLGSKTGNFIGSLLSLYNETPLFSQVAPDSIIQSAMIAATLDLPINKNLGFAWVIPYKHDGVMYAQFQMGYKGLVQLAMRSGQFARLNAVEIRDGQIESYNEVTGDIKFSDDYDKAAKVVGYLSYFRLLSGFEDYKYMTAKDMQTHAKRYSQSYKNNSGVWATDYDKMAKKTVMKLQLNSGKAPLSIELVQAIQKDQEVDGEYSDNKVGFVVSDRSENEQGSGTTAPNVIDGEEENNG